MSQWSTDHQLGWKGYMAVSRFWNKVFRHFQEFIFIFFYFCMQDNAYYHHSVCVEKQLHTQGIKWMDQPKFLSDLNHVKPISDAFWWSTAENKPQPTFKKKLLIALKHEWWNLFQELLANLVWRLYNQCLAYMTIRSGHIIILIFFY